MPLRNAPNSPLHRVAGSARLAERFNALEAEQARQGEVHLGAGGVAGAEGLMLPPPPPDRMVARITAWDAGADEEQSVTITGSPTGGTFTLSYDGQTTGPLAYNAATGTLVANLQGLPNVGAGNVNVTGGPLPGTAVTVTFTGDLGYQDVPLLAADGSGLTGGTSPAVTVAEATAGAPRGYSWTLQEEDGLGGWRDADPEVTGEPGNFPAFEFSGNEGVPEDVVVELRPAAAGEWFYFDAAGDLVVQESDGSPSYATTTLQVPSGEDILLLNGSGKTFLRAAGKTNGGWVTKGTQVIKGDKRFYDDVLVSGEIGVGPRELSGGSYNTGGWYLWSGGASPADPEYAGVVTAFNVGGRFDDGEVDNGDPGLHVRTEELVGGISGAGVVSIRTFLNCGTLNGSWDVTKERVGFGYRYKTTSAGAWQTVRGVTQTVTVSTPGGDTTLEFVGGLLVAVGGAPEESGSGGGGGGVVPTECCPDRDLPADLTATLTATGCDCLDGLTVPLTWAGGENWGGDVTACTGKTVSVLLTCSGGSWSLYLTCDEGSSSATDPVAETSSTCDPLSLAFLIADSSARELCCGVADLAVFVEVTE